MKGLRCARCPGVFYQAGMGVWLWSSLLMPITPFFLIHWAVGIVAMVAEVLHVMVYINRRMPLLAAQRS
ncbi:hypothetical protein [Hydrogenophaga sp. BPS33]|uniref:hypothetical protein n=1 Tax=Hydrogenophaga sp. BPS33 TaxID=2651974 RepID=UPI00131F8C4C|nr:hypothetical protein [Hydrogenophaga sp. BPS33]QHE86417.1 hypothetical protein F9K07_16660 [Hydrogenophaga sp. BPS33]